MPPRKTAAAKSPARARSKSPARGAVKRSRSTSRARGDAKRADEAGAKVKGQADKRAIAPKIDPRFGGVAKAVAITAVAKKKLDGENAPVGGGHMLHLAVAGAYSLMAYTIWSSHADTVKGATGLTAQVDVWTNAVVAPLYFVISFLAIHKDNKDIENIRNQIFNFVLGPLVSILALSAFLAQYKLDGHVKEVDMIPADFTAAASTVLALEQVAGVGIAQGYTVLSARFVLLVGATGAEALLCYPNDNKGLVTDIIGVVAGFVAFAAFFVFVCGQDQSQFLEVASAQAYIVYTLGGLLVKKVIGFTLNGLTKGTADAEVVQANLVISGSGGDPKLLAKKDYAGIVVGSTANPSQKIKAKAL